MLLTARSPNAEILELVSIELITTKESESDVLKNSSQEHLL